MAKLTPSEFAAKWGSRLRGATSDIQRGAERVSEAPGKAAAAAKGKWVAKMTDPKTHEKWSRNVEAVSLDEWRTKMISVGIAHIAAGTSAAEPKVTTFAEQLLSYQNAGLAKIHSMPSLTLADTRARMDAWFDYMSKFQPRK